MATTFRAAFAGLLDDLRAARADGVMLKAPAKGLRRSVLICGWLALHIFELAVLIVYGAFPRGPVHASWWLLTTLVAGLLYIRVVFSDPGFVDAAMLQRMVDDLGLSVTVAGTDASRGLLADVEAVLPRAQELLPVREYVPEQPLGGADGAAPTAPAAHGSSGGRAKVAPTDSSAAGSSTDPLPDAGEPAAEQPTEESSALPLSEIAVEGADDEEAEEEKAAAERLRRKLAYKPRMAGVVEVGAEEAIEELERQRQERLSRPDGLETYFTTFCEPADMHLPIRSKYTKKSGRVIAKFDHYCYALGNAVGELNHGAFWRFLFVQVASIWLGKWLLAVAYLDFGRKAVWVVANAPLLVLNALTWIFGIPLTVLLVTHTFMAMTSTTTYEWLKLEKLEYMQGFYEFSFPFSEGLCANLRHFCCPAGIKLWRRPPPESDWPETFWRNRYYSCFG